MLIDQLDPPVVVVLRHATSAPFGAVTEALVAGGVRAVEFTLTSTGAAEALVTTREALGADVMLGLGTVRTRAHLETAAAVGADFAVSQYRHPELMAASSELAVDYIPGALTPTEIVAASEAGARTVKVSPIGPVGGLAYLRELVGPLPGLRLFPTGGVRPEEAGDYLRAGAALVGLSALLLQDALDDGDLTALTARTRAALATIEGKHT